MDEHRARRKQGSFSQNRDGTLGDILHGLRRFDSELRRRVDVRLVCATNRNLEQLMASGGFRPDLYHRISVVTVRLPPLRSFKQNLPVIAEVFLRQANRRYGREAEYFSPEAIEVLKRYDRGRQNGRKLTTLPTDTPFRRRGGRGAQSCPRSISCPRGEVRRTRDDLCVLRVAAVDRGDPGASCPDAGRVAPWGPEGEEALVGGVRAHRGALSAARRGASGLIRS